MMTPDASPLDVSEQPLPATIDRARGWVGPSPRTAAWRPVGTALCALIVSRLIFEAATTFAWDNASYVWSAIALVAIVALLWPMVLLLSRGERSLLLAYSPVFVYLAVILARMSPGSGHSLKCFFSEFIVYSCMVFTAAACAHSREIAERIRQSILWLVKANILIGVGQLLAAVARGEAASAPALLEARPVQGVFVHPNLFLVVILPFVFYFVKHRRWFWCLLALLVCAGTGTRSPVFAAACLIIPAWQSARNRPIAWRHLGLTLAIVVIAYTALIRSNLNSWEYDPDSRTSLSTLQWRIVHWQHYLENRETMAFLFGNGVGTADDLAAVPGEEPLLPHNDYLRTYFDTGVLGLLATALLIGFVIWRLKRSITVENDYILLGFLLIVCFRITDNFMYQTTPLWIYMLVASYMVKPPQAHADSPAAESYWGGSE